MLGRLLGQELSAEKDRDRVTKDALAEHARGHDGSEWWVRERMALRGGKQADAAADLGLLGAGRLAGAAIALGRRASQLLGRRASQLLAPGHLVPGRGAEEGEVELGSVYAEARRVSSGSVLGVFGGGIGGGGVSGGGSGGSGLGNALRRMSSRWQQRSTEDEEHRATKNGGTDGGGGGSGGVSPLLLATLVDMGVGWDHAAAALRRFPGDLERAHEWALSTSPTTSPGTSPTTSPGASLGAGRRQLGGGGGGGKEQTIGGERDEESVADAFEAGVRERSSTSNETGSSSSSSSSFN